METIGHKSVAVAEMSGDYLEDHEKCVDRTTDTHYPAYGMCRLTALVGESLRKGF